MKLKTIGIWLADKIASGIGSWTFIIIQSIILTTWVVLNALHVASFDPYPFILLNLFLSFEAAYATPLLLMSSNRSTARDRKYLMQVLEHDSKMKIDVVIITTKLEQILNDIREIKQQLKP